MKVSDMVPRISCLMITTDRLVLAKRSIQCFIDQTYPRLELIVVSAGDRAYSRALEHHLEHQGVGNARLIAADPGSTLGALRNLSLDAATGDIVCQWDDDDCYHPERVSRQVEQMTREGARACFLTDNLYLLEPDKKLFWIDWTWNLSYKLRFRLLQGTLMMVNDDRFRYPETGACAHIGEDEDLAARLFQEVPVAMMNSMGWLYIYVFHGRNTCSKEQHYRIIADHSIPNEWVEARSKEIRQAMRHYPIEGPVIVCGARGPVFRLP